MVADGLFFACRDPSRQPDFTGAGGPAAAAFWDHFTPAYVLGEIEHTRALVVRIRASRHTYNSDDPWYSCSQSEDPDPLPEDGPPSPGSGCLDDRRRGKPCDCGRDDRIRGMLAGVASRWNSHPDYDPGWNPAVWKP